MEIKCSYTELRDPLALVKNPRNSNKHPKKQIEQLSRIMKANGFRSPIVISKRSGFIVKGHGRLEAAIMGGWKQVPVDVQDYENEAAEVADLEADNRIALLAELDEDASKENALFLMEHNYDLDFGGFDLSFMNDLHKDEEIESNETLLQDDDEELNKGNEKPDVKFSEFIGESNNYVVLIFKNDIDWLAARDHFKIERAAATRRTGEMWSIGTGRVIDGAMYLEGLKNEI